ASTGAWAAHSPSASVVRVAGWVEVKRAISRPPFPSGGRRWAAEPLGGGGVWKWAYGQPLSSARRAFPSSVSLREPPSPPRGEGRGRRCSSRLHPHRGAVLDLQGGGDVGGHAGQVAVDQDSGAHGAEGGDAVGRDEGG